jgi:hypothetical protein
MTLKRTYKATASLSILTDINSSPQSRLVACEFVQLDTQRAKFAGTVTYETLDSNTRTFSTLFVSGFYAGLRRIATIYRNEPIAFAMSSQMPGRTMSNRIFKLSGAAVYLTSVAETDFFDDYQAAQFTRRQVEKHLYKRRKAGYVTPLDYGKVRRNDWTSQLLNKLREEFTLEGPIGFTLQPPVILPLPPALPEALPADSMTLAPFNPFGPRRRRITLLP